MSTMNFDYTYCTKSHLLQLISKCYRYICSVYSISLGTELTYFHKDILERIRF